MEEPVGAQYAIQIAVHTLKDRCRNLQQRIDVLEDENMNLRIVLSKTENIENSLSEIGTLKQHITELTEQNSQLQSKCKIVITENDDLWKKLSKLTKVNRNLGTQLNKISDTLTQHTASPSTALIRSKTFTQVEPQTKILQKNLEENDKISLELEDISLKIRDSISKQKLELDELVSEMGDMKFTDYSGCSNLILNGNFGFNYDDEEDEDILEEIETVSKDFNAVLSEILIQKAILLKQIQLVEKYQEAKQKTVIIEMYDKETNTDSISKTKSVEEKLSEMGEGKQQDSNLYKPPNLLNEVDKICPMCCKNFYKETDFDEFQRHVELHFSDDFEVL